MEEELPEGRFFATFEKYQDFTGIQDSLLSCDLHVEPSEDEDKYESGLLKSLSDILDEYQEQSYLLDPFLEKLVTPVADKLRLHAKTYVLDGTRTISTPRVSRVATLLYLYTKFRGYKTITRFLPHEIPDLSIALDYMTVPGGLAQEPVQWPLRYVILLWLSLVCMIPFDLAQFDDGVNRTAEKLEFLGDNYLSKAGLEREGAAILLSRLYVRKDVSARFSDFLKYAQSQTQEPLDLFKFIGTLQVISEVLKLGSAGQIQANSSSILDVVRAAEKSTTLMNNTIVRKLRTKLLSRVALRLLPAKLNFNRRKGPSLMPADAMEDETSIDDNIDVPEEVETVMEDLFGALQDKDTLVRWSAAKGVARIAERLPTEFVNQIFEQVLGLFSIHSVAAANLYDLPAIAESTWHGACLACAEIARRGLVANDTLPQLIDWLSQALYFDIRKGSFSIGSNVRDAATYVLWSLARAQDISALSPLAENLARRLVTVSLFDREVHVRRAASAAFQEYVGRTGLFPHGIDVLRKTDFYAVGVRRNAFMSAAPEVAEHDVYRLFLIHHLVQVTLRHWDPNMRELGSQSLKAICQLDLYNLCPRSAEQAAQLLKSLDIDDLHGGLLALAELASAYDGSSHDTERVERKREIFKYLNIVPLSTLQVPRNSLAISAACYLIASSITMEEISLNEHSSVIHWRLIIDSGLKHRDGKVQEQAANAMAAMLIYHLATTLIHEFKPGSPILQQSLGRFLGVLDYTAYPHSLPDVVQCLLDCVNSSSPTRFSNVEARRNCYTSMCQIYVTVCTQVSEHLSTAVANDILGALKDGLSDYTVDERGDVGSWIRIACIKGLTEAYLSDSIYHEIIGGILKQGVERLDNVRQHAGEHFLRLLVHPLPRIPDAELWRVRGDTFIKELFLSDDETTNWKEGTWLFPKAVQLLQVDRYRKSVLAGLVLSVGSKTDSTQRPVSSSLVGYAQTLPLTASGDSGYSLCALVEDLLEEVKGNTTSNNIVIPILQTVNILLEADALSRLADIPQGLESLRGLLSVVSRNIPRLKNVQRIQISMQIVVNLLAVPPLYSACIPLLSDFLTHKFPKIRSDTVEYLYIILQSKDLEYETETAEDILLESEWTTTDSEVVSDAAQRLLNSLLVEET